MIAALAVVALLVAGCSSDSNGSSDAGATTTSATAAGGATSDGSLGTGQTTVTSASNGPTITVVVQGDDVVEGSGRHDVDLGSDVTIEVTSDSDNEVHVHGYDLHADVGPDQPAVIQFTADIPGIFEVELEDNGKLLFELQVQ
jgi:hypothetical protein